VRDENVTDDQQQQQKATEVLQLLHEHCSDAQLGCYFDQIDPLSSYRFNRINENMAIEYPDDDNSQLKIMIT
jgi:hypothetical protein